MKKSISLLLALLILLPLCARGKSDRYKSAIETAETMNSSYAKVYRYYNTGDKNSMKYELIIFMEHFNNTIDSFMQLNSSEMQDFMKEISKANGNGYKLLYNMLSGKISTFNQDPEFCKLYTFATS